MSFSTPIILLVFNRPNLTRQMFQSIRELQPETLLIVADGPRPDYPEDNARCLEVRNIVTSVDWPCNIQLNFAASNLGLQTCVSSGISWAFNLVEEAIIIEDDCIPDPSFFPFCQELLQRYANDERIMSISGNNFQFGNTPQIHSYYFSRIMHCWGWATWKRAWSLHDPEMPFWEELKRDGWLESFIVDPHERHHHQNAFDAAKSGQLNSWATKWTYTIMRNSALNIHPGLNLVSNIGFGEDGTHCTNTDSPVANLPRTPLKFPLIHPTTILRNFICDDYYARVFFRQKRKYNW